MGSIEAKSVGSTYVKHTIEAKNVTHFKLCYQRDKRSNYDLK